MEKEDCRKVMLDLLRACWEKRPEMRLGQLIWNLLALSTKPPGVDGFYIKDAALESKMREFLEEE